MCYNFIASEHALYQILICVDISTSVTFKPPGLENEDFLVDYVLERIV